VADSISSAAARPKPRTTPRLGPGIFIMRETSGMGDDSVAKLWSAFGTFICDRSRHRIKVGDLNAV
jgi:hypothetical protein